MHNALSQSVMFCILYEWAQGCVCIETQFIILSPRQLSTSTSKEYQESYATSSEPDDWLLQLKCKWSIKTPSSQTLLMDIWWGLGVSVVHMHWVTHLLSAWRPFKLWSWNLAALIEDKQQSIEWASTHLEAWLMSLVTCSDQASIHHGSFINDPIYEW